MSIKLGQNIQSIGAQRQLDISSQKLASIYERLASGQRINKSSDDAAGLAIATTLNASARVFNQAIRNINDGISFTNIIEGAFSQLSAITTRQQELATQSANGVFSNTQREALQNEVAALIDEYNRILDSTSFNGLSAFAQSESESELRIQLGYGVEGSIAINRPTITTTGGSEAAEGLTFSGMSSYSAGTTNIRQLRVGDFNEDSIDDIVMFSTDNLYRVFIANGNGTFQAPFTLENDLGATSLLAVGDVNADGNQDILSGPTTIPGGSYPSVSFGNGDGTFSDALTDWSRSLFASAGIALHDLNGDGRADLTRWAGNGITVMLTQAGANPFQNGTSYTYPDAVTINSVSFADVNGDTHLDMVASEQFGDPNLYVFINNGSGGFAAAVSHPTANNFVVGNNLFGDFNGDTFQDIMTGAGDLLLGNGNGTFNAAATVFTGFFPASTVARDINADGFDDFIGYASGTTRYFLSNGDGSFAAGISVPNLTNQDFQIGDFNGDGKLDFAGTSSTSGNLNIYLNTSGEESGSSGTRSGAIAPVNIDISTQVGAREAIDLLANQLQQISTELGAIGAFRSRLETALSGTAATRENYLAAESRIKDTDIAQEAAELSRVQILQQAGASVLAQANQAPALALVLLR